MKFVPFNKIPRLNRDIVITEKLDGTNASVTIEDSTMIEDESLIIAEVDGLALLAGSRNRFITPSNDNFGFAAWVEANASELVKLGVGTHYGEWWGKGIQRGYGLDHKRFSLFNVKRWGEERPACCHVVPKLYEGEFNQSIISSWVYDLATSGSYAAPGFVKPEGIIVYHTAANQMFKVTCEDDDKPKGQT